jgi:hypothetical protein
VDIDVKIYFMSSGEINYYALREMSSGEINHDALREIHASIHPSITIGCLSKTSYNRLFD